MCMCDNKRHGITALDVAIGKTVGQRDAIAARNYCHSCTPLRRRFPPSRKFI